MHIFHIESAVLDISGSVNLFFKLLSYAEEIGVKLSGLQLLWDTWNEND